MPEAIRTRGRVALKKTTAFASRAAATFVALLISAETWFLLLMLGGGAAIVAGIHELAGQGWALLAGGLLCIGAATYMRRGMNG